MLRQNLAFNLLFAAIITVGCYFLMSNTILCDKELCPYTDRFISEAKARHIKYSNFYLLSVRFASNMEPGVAGVSYDSNASRNKLINISREVWRSLTEEQKIMLVAHEMGHSVLHRDHVSTVMLDNSPVSIMYPSIFYSYLFSRNQEHYWNELFSIQDDL